MGLGPAQAKQIALLVLGLIIIAGLIVVIQPVLLGVGKEAATALDTNLASDNVYVNVTKAAGDTALAQVNIFSFLPWLGIGLIFLYALVKRNTFNIGL